MTKKLILYKCTEHGKFIGQHKIYIAAYNIKEAAALLTKSVSFQNVPIPTDENVIKEKFTKKWDEDMAGVTPTVAGLWVSIKGSKPHQIL